MNVSVLHADLELLLGRAEAEGGKVVAIQAVRQLLHADLRRAAIHEQARQEMAARAGARAA